MCTDYRVGEVLDIWSGGQLQCTSCGGNQGDRYVDQEWPSINLSLILCKGTS